MYQVYEGSTDSFTHPLHGDHPAVQLGPVKVTDALRRLLCGRHGDVAVAAGAGTLGVGHYFGSDDLRSRTVIRNRGGLCLDQDHVLLPGDEPQGRVPTLPYLLNRVFRSVALVVEDRPLTHRFLLLLLTAAPPATATWNIKL